MQYVLGIDDRAEILLKINRRLRRHLGAPPIYLRLDPVSQLVMSLIGGRTRSDVSCAAFERLRHQFGTWNQVRDASVSDIKEALRTVTFFEVKAVRLKAALMKISNSEGMPSLDHLYSMTVREAHIWLERLPGVGRKVSAAVLNFSTLRRNTLVIDTHHLRILRRLGFIERRARTIQAYDRIMPLLPQNWKAEDYDGHHTLMKRHGQTMCRHATPICGHCPLEDICHGSLVRA